MTKKTKAFTLICVISCILMQFTILSSGVTEGGYSKTLPNMQEKVILISGTNATSTPARTYMTFSGGTANKIYVQTQRTSDNTAVTSGWKELSLSSYYQSIDFLTTLNPGTGLKVVAYQKNVLNKTASGYIYI